jgi:hypothetical protein
MLDQESVIAEQAERITKLEAQTLELQQQLKRLQGRADKRKRSKLGFWQSLTGSHGELRESLLRTNLVLGAFVLFPPMMFGLSAGLIDLVPGGAALWVPVWWIALFLSCALGAVLFVSSRD